jgi:hypothetical protein
MRVVEMWNCSVLCLAMFRVMFGNVQGYVWQCSRLCLAMFRVMFGNVQEIYPFKDETKSVRFKEPVRTAQ